MKEERRKKREARRAGKGGGADVGDKTPRGEIDENGGAENDSPEAN
mgnify:CR=1 FL=1